MNKINRKIQGIAAVIVICTLALMPFAFINFNAPVEVTPVQQINAVPNPMPGIDVTCSYDLTTEESGLPAIIYIDLMEGGSLDLTFGVNIKFHAECIAGKIRYWIVEIDPMCIQGSITLSSDGTWGCTLETNDPHIVAAFLFELGGHWKWPQGQPNVEWTEPPLVPLMTPPPNRPRKSTP